VKTAAIEKRDHSQTQPETFGQRMCVCRVVKRFTTAISTDVSIQ